MSLEHFLGLVEELVVEDPAEVPAVAPAGMLPLRSSITHVYLLSGLPTLIDTIDSSYGAYHLAGCSDAGPAGYILNGAHTSNASMTLEDCASFCQGTPYLAVQNGTLTTIYLKALLLTLTGNECICGSAAPAGSPVDIAQYGCATVCTGNNADVADHLDTALYTIVHHVLAQALDQL